MEQTPLEMLIDKIDAEILNNPYYINSPRFREAAYTIKIMATSLLPAEREAIEEAYKKGCKDTYGCDAPYYKDPNDNESASDYFTNKFGKK